MTKKARAGIRVLFGVSAFLLIAAAANAAPSTRAASSQPELIKKYSVRIERLVHDLGSDNQATREAAENAIYMLPAEAFPLVVAASKRDLPASVGEKLHHIIEHERPWIEVRRRRATEVYETWQWNLRTALEAYNRFGKKNQKWDAVARKGITLYVAPHPDIQVESQKDREIRRTLEEAIHAGCDDPLVMYMAAVKRAQWDPQSPLLDDFYFQAVDAMVQSQYPCDRKAWALMHYFQYKWDRIDHGKPIDQKTNQRLWLVEQTALHDWPEVLKVPGFPKTFAVELSGLIMNAQQWKGGPRKKAFDQMYVPLQQAFPQSPIPLIFEGQFYINYAWDARGGGWANTVTPEGWKLMGERLAKAQAILEKAWKMDPDDSSAAVAMMSVELGQGQGRARMEKWFERAMVADPDNMQACRSKLYYLEPKWHGSPQDMLTFGRECLADKNWYAGIPFILVEAHESLVKYVKDKDAYFALPQVWSDLKSVYETYLRAVPQNASVRSRWAYYACRCGQWDEARRQFAILGNNAVPARFGGQQALEKFRKEANAHAAPSTQARNVE